MKLTTSIAAFLAVFLLSQSAQARAHYQHSHVAHHDAGRRAYAYAPQEGHYGYGARPSAWCGWEMRHLVSGDPDPEYNLARNCGRWGHAGAPGVGAVVVWSHHVGKTVGKEGGMWVVQSGNDDHAIRTRPRSIGGAIAIRWGNIEHQIPRPPVKLGGLIPSGAAIAVAVGKGGQIAAAGTKPLPVQPCACLPIA